jgi:hypothetical protein
MAIDPSISLGFRPPQIAPLEIQTPLERFGKILTLQNLMRQGEMGQLQLEQARTAAEQQKSLAKLMQDYYTGQQPTAAPVQPPIAPPAGAYVPGQLGASPGLESLGRTQPPIAPPVSAGDTTLGGLPQSRLSGLPSDADILRVAPGPVGLNWIKTTREMRKADLEEQLAQLNLHKGQSKEMSDKATTIIDNETKNRVLAEAGRNGWIPWEQVRQFSERDFNDPVFQSQLKEWQTQTLGYDKTVDLRIKQAKEARDALEGQDKQQQREYDQAVQDVYTLNNVQDIPGFIQRQGPYAQAFLGRIAAGAKDLKDFQERVLNAVNAEKIAVSAATGLATEQTKQALKDKRLSQIRDQVVANPKIWNTLDPETQKDIRPLMPPSLLPELGKALSEKEIDTLQQQGSALNLLTQMRQGVTDNKNLFGWAEGLKANIPWDVEHKKAQTILKLGDQVIGKMLEGGVLRKEDENKYRDMLPQLTDPYDVATHKMDVFERNVQEQYQRYRQTLKETGRQLPETVTTPKPPAGTKPSYQTIERIEAGTTPPQRIEPDTVKPSERTASGAVVAAPPGSTPRKFVKDGEEHEVWIGPDGKYYDLPPEPILAPGKSAPLKTAPPIGTIEDGHVFLGGDPSQPSSWKKTKQ